MIAVIEEQAACVDSNASSPKHDSKAVAPDSTSVWGVPFTPVTYEQSIQLIDASVQNKQPGYFITANMQYVMLSDQHPALDQVNRDADYIFADGMPIVWRSRSTESPIPERVAGSDQIYGIAELAAQKGYSIFLLGGEPGIAQSTADILQQKYAGLEIAGVECPPFRDLGPDEDAAMVERIKATRPDILLVALGQPKGELWISKWYKQLEVPLSVQLGGSFNFVTGNISRSPEWIAKIGMEWFYRFYREPRRLGPRYARNWLFLAKALLKDATRSW